MEDTMVDTPTEEILQDKVEKIRSQCKGLEEGTRFMMGLGVFKEEQAFSGQHSEMKAQIMLAVRHFEDARMRLGKVIQYSQDGVSIFDKKRKQKTGETL